MTKLFVSQQNDPRYLHTADIENIEDHYRSEIAHFFPSLQRIRREKSGNYRMGISKGG